MPTLTIDEVNNTPLQFQKSITNSRESLRIASTKWNRPFDIFLSHAYADAKFIEKVKTILEGYGYSIFVDWLEDEFSERNEVSVDTAYKLRQVMNSSKCLLYATSSLSQRSKWMPWECGYFDGIKGRCAILPITKDAIHNFQGLEFLKLYPYVTIDENTNDKMQLFVNRKRDVYVGFDSWLKGKNPYKRN